MGVRAACKNYCQQNILDRLVGLIVVNVFNRNASAADVNSSPLASSLLLFR